MSARTDLPVYNNALKTGQNFIISSQGGASFREGLEYIGIPPSNQKFRIFQFRRGGDKADVLLEVSEGLIRYWIEEDGQASLFVDNTSLLLDEDTGDFIIDETTGQFLTTGVVVTANTYSEEDMDDLYFINQDKYGIICSSRHPPIYVTIRRDGTIISDSFDRGKIPEWYYNDANTPRLVSESGDWQIIFGEEWANNLYLYGVGYNGVVARTDDNVTLIFKFSETPAVNAQNIETGLNAAAEQQGFGTVFSVTPDGTSNLVYIVTASGDNSTWSIYIGAIVGYNPSGYIISPTIQSASELSLEPITEPAWSYPQYVYEETTAKYYRCDRVHRSDSTTQPGVGEVWTEYWTDMGIAEPVGYLYMFRNGNIWAADKIYAPFDRGFPTVAEFHDQRLLFMANKDNPTAIYGSGLGSYQNFIVGVNDDEPFIFVLDSTDSPQIKWATSMGNLTLGTSSGEWSLTAEATLTPTDIHAEQQNFARSHLGRPVAIDVELFYIELGRRNLRSTRYMRENLAYTSTDASIFAEHLVSDVGIRRLAAFYVPEVMLAIVRNDGQLTCLTYEKNQPILAYSELVTDGSIFDIAGYFSFAHKRDFMYFVTERNGQYMLERMRYPCAKLCQQFTENRVVHMDGWITGIIEDDVIDGLLHLEGKEVGLIANNSWVGSFTVQGGQITLPVDDVEYNGMTFSAGLVYEGILETFEQNANLGPTALGTKRRWNKLFTRILNSALPKVYTHLDRDRLPSVPMGVGDTVREGIQDVEQSVAGYGDGSVKIVQDRPFPTYVVALFGEYEVESR